MRNLKLYVLTESSTVHGYPAFAAMRVYALRKNWLLSLTVLGLYSVSVALNFVSLQFIHFAFDVRSGGGQIHRCRLGCTSD